MMRGFSLWKDSKVEKISKIMSTSLSEKYSKWDHLVVSSDDEDDCHPNIDIKLWKRLQKEKRERTREEQDDRIEALRARIEAVRNLISCRYFPSDDPHNHRHRRLHLLTKFKSGKMRS